MTSTADLSPDPTPHAGPPHEPLDSPDPLARLGASLGGAPKRTATPRPRLWTENSALRALLADRYPADGDDAMATTATVPGGFLG